MRVRRVAFVVGVYCSGGGLLSARSVAATTKAPTTATSTRTATTATTAAKSATTSTTTATTTPTTPTARIFQNKHPFRGGWGGSSSSSSSSRRRPSSGDTTAEAAKSWLSAAALRITTHEKTSGSSRAKTAWATYELRRAELEAHPQDPRLQLDTAEALLKWMRHTTNGNFPRASTGKVCEGDSPASRTIWRKHAPEALRLLKAGAAHAQQSGTYDLAKVNESL